MGYSVANSDVCAWAKSFDGPLFHGCFCDPPYELGFMGKKWDSTGVAFQPETWSAVSKCLHPGAYLLAFGGTRTFHRLACAIEDAGFEIRDTLMWVYGSGFPKSLDVSKAIDGTAGRIGENVSSIKREIRRRYELAGMTLLQFNKACGFEASGYLRETSTWASVLPSDEKWSIMKRIIKCGTELDDLFARAEREIIGEASWSNSASHFVPGADHSNRVTLNITAPTTESAKQWDGYGTALKPAWEPIILARKPIEGTVASNVLKYGCGAINIDGCRIGENDGTRNRPPSKPTGLTFAQDKWTQDPNNRKPFVALNGRWPANLIHDGSQMVLDLFDGKSSGHGHFPRLPHTKNNIYGKMRPIPQESYQMSDNGDKSAARFFYCAKASKKERDEGLTDLPVHSASDCVDRQPDSAGMNSPRAGAGRTSGRRNNHPTVKPIALCQYLAKLILPPTADSRILVPFSGSGSEMIGCHLAGWSFVQGVEKEGEYVNLSTERLNHWTTSQPAP